jgi:hypothetical protein
LETGSRVPQPSLTHTLSAEVDVELVILLLLPAECWATKNFWLTMSSHYTPWMLPPKHRAYIHACHAENVVSDAFMSFILFSLIRWLDGAALIYTSVKENKNIDLVYKYIVQKLYGFPYKIPAVVVEKDAVFM